MPFKAGFDRPIHPTSAMTLFSDLCVIVGERTLNRPPFSIAIETSGRGVVSETLAWEERNASAIPQETDSPLQRCYVFHKWWELNTHSYTCHVWTETLKCPFCSFYRLAFFFWFLFPPVSAVYHFKHVFICWAVFNKQKRLFFFLLEIWFICPLL